MSQAPPQNTHPRRSLLSLSIAAAAAHPMPPTAPLVEPAPRPAAHRTSQQPTAPAISTSTSTTKHRRLSSLGRSRRRRSDARDAAARPLPTPLQTASASLAALSLSSPTPSHHRLVNGAQPIQVSLATSTRDMPDPSTDDIRLSVSPPHAHTPLASSTRAARKRATIFTCESCSKVYRHPSCLIKHRWEHTPQWQEASKFVLSKHQQVQLLEAAAILSHLSPSSASLPEDRSLWPSFLSGGLVPPPGSIPSDMTTPALPVSDPISHVLPAHPISSSVPASSTHIPMHGVAGPQLHHYAIGHSDGVTQVRPGMLGVPTGHKPKPEPTTPMAVPAPTTEDDALNLLALRSGTGTGMSASVPVSSYGARTHGHSRSYSIASPSHVSKERARRRSNAYEYGFIPETCGSGLAPEPESGHDHVYYARHAYVPRLNGGWSLPHSSVRSKSGSSQSRSQSRSASEGRSDDEREYGYGYDHGCEDADEGDTDVRVGFGDEADDSDRLGVYRARDDRKARVERTWDGMEMEMEMD